MSAALNNVKSEYSRIAGEIVDVEMVGGTLYVFGSEMATLRPFRAMPNKRQGYSKNLGKFFFAVDIS